MLSLNPTQMQGIDYLTGFGQNAFGQGVNFMNQGGASVQTIKTSITVHQVQPWITQSICDLITTELSH